jgi:hypothetical protein
MGADEGGHTSAIRSVLERAWAGWLGLVDGFHFLGKTVTGRSISLPGDAIVQGRERIEQGFGGLGLKGNQREEERLAADSKKTRLGTQFEFRRG